jgi:phosphatidate cytidylyltransferase
MADIQKTGRNLQVATTVGLALFVVLVGSLYFNPVFYALLASVFAGFASREVFKIFGLRNGFMFYVGLVAISVIVLITYFGGLNLALIVAMGVWISLSIFRLQWGPKGFANDIGAFSVAIIYIAAMLSFSVDLAHHEDGFERVFAVMLLTIANDTGGFFVGVRFGKHKMAPIISPRKTWEGFIGGLIMQLLIGVFVVPAHLLSISMLQGFVMALVLTLTATFGDLIESAIKRDLHIKDSSDVIPGHGGVLDRVDAHLINAFVGWVLITQIFGL